MGGPWLGERALMLRYHLRRIGSLTAACVCVCVLGKQIYVDAAR